MKTLPHLFERNREWASRVTATDPEFFARLVRQQAPELLWIGCSDSRVPANQIVDLPPGQLFVHRNVANLVVHSDMNCLAAIQYSVEVLQVKHVVVCGHYGCGGVAAAMEERPHGMIDNWLGHIRDVYRRRQSELAEIEDTGARMNRLCEYNVIAQVCNVGHTTIVQEAWAHGRPLYLHGWIYGLQNGLLRDLNVSAESQEDLAALEHA